MRFWGFEVLGFWGFVLKNSILLKSIIKRTIDRHCRPSTYCKQSLKVTYMVSNNITYQLGKGESELIIILVAAKHYHLISPFRSNSGRS